MKDVGIPNAGNHAGAVCGPGEPGTPCARDGMADMFGFKIIRQYEQGVVFRFGRALPGVRKPGLIWINPFTSRLTKVNMQIAVASVPAQETITRDNVTLRVDAVVYYRVVDPLKAIINVQNYHFAVSQVAQTSLRSVTGRSNMDQLLSEREHVNAELKDVIDAPTEGPWGVRVERVEVKDISLPESMKRSMSRQAEAEREKNSQCVEAHPGPITGSDTDCGSPIGGRNFRCTWGRLYGKSNPFTLGRCFPSVGQRNPVLMCATRQGIES